MDTYEKIEDLVAAKYGKSTTTRKHIGDFMMKDDHAVNVKSNNVAKQNYSPNMISIKKLHKWVFEERKTLSFIFVDYEMERGNPRILKRTGLIPVEHIGWDCLSIEAQGYGVIQKIGDLITIDTQTKRVFYKGFLKEYERYLRRERKKHANFAKRFIDPNTIDW